MVLTWIIGVYGMYAGYGVASLLRGGKLPDLSAITIHTGTLAGVSEYAAIQQFESMLAHPRVTFPLAVAQALLSGLLVVASGLAMGGRRGARSLALQALGANAILVILTFLLTPFQRAAYLEGVLHAVESLPPAQRELATPAILQWGLRIRLLIFDLGVFAVAALALTRARTRTYFEAVSRATEGPEDP